MSENLGRFTWYELMTTDVDAGVDFYTELVGWGHMPWEGPNHYELLMRGEMPQAGVMQLPEQASAAGAPPHWMGYVFTPDLDATTAKARELGASILAEMSLPKVGRIAVMADPQGVTIAGFQPEQEPIPDHDPEPGEVSWHELSTTDYRAAFDFYQALFGWEVMEDMDMGEMGVYRIFGRKGRQLGGMWNKPDEMPACWMYYVRVADLDAAVATIEKAGGKILNGPMVVPDGSRIVQAMDPQGAAFALHEAAAQA